MNIADDEIRALLAELHKRSKERSETATRDFQGDANARMYLYGASDAYYTASVLLGSVCQRAAPTPAPTPAHHTRPCFYGHSEPSPLCPACVSAESVRKS